SQQLWWPASWATGLWRERPLTRRPNRGRFSNANRITQPLSGHPIAKVGTAAKGQGCVDHSARQSGFDRRNDLFERYLRLGAELNFTRHAGLFPPPPIFGPFLRQEQLEGDRQTGQPMRQAERNGDLAIVRLSQLPTVLPSYSRRMPTAFGKARIIND